MVLSRVSQGGLMSSRIRCTPCGAENCLDGAFLRKLDKLEAGKKAKEGQP